MADIEKTVAPALEDLSELAGCTGEGFVLAMAAAYKAGLEAAKAADKAA